MYKKPRNNNISQLSTKNEIKYFKKQVPPRFTIEVQQAID